MLPPTIIKPLKLWSGKQIISTLLINLIPKNMSPINLTAGTKINAKNWETHKPRPWNGGGTEILDNNLSESEVIIRNGEILCGILDKNHIGSTPFGLVHCIYELYGGDCSSALLSALSKLFTFYLQLEAFTLGVKDILVVDKADKKRKKLIAKGRQAGISVIQSIFELEHEPTVEELTAKIDDAYSKDPKFRTVLDRKYKQVLDGVNNAINKVCVPAGLITKFPKNNLQLMVSYFYFNFI